MKKTFVLDTNVLLHSAKSIENFQDNTVVLPMAVIEELDKFKKHQDELGRNARHVIRRLDELRKKGSLYNGVPLDNSGDPEKCGYIQIVTGVGEVVDGMDMSVPDNRILRVAYMLRRNDPNVILVSKDINLRLKADALGLQVADFEFEKVNFDELYTGVTELSVASEELNSFYQSGGMALPEGNFYPNEFVILQDGANPKKTAFGWVKNDRIVPLPESTDRVWNISPRSREQRMALAMLMDPEIQIVTLVGRAGSGKTLLALAAGLENVLHRGIYDKLLVSRPIIPMGNDLGFLPGSKDDKLDIWMQPIYDNLDFLLRSEKKESHSSRKQVEELKRARKLELEALTYIRGRSIPQQYLIVDEAQNLTPHEVKTIVSRAGEGTKVVLTGDPNQIDNAYLDSSSNGLSYAAERLKSLPLHGHITLQKSERSPLASAAAEYL